MTLEDFNDWKASPQTKEIFNSIAKRVYDIQVDLGSNAGRDGVEDSRRSGAIQALQDLLAIEFEDTKSE